MIIAVTTTFTVHAQGGDKALGGSFLIAGDETILVGIGAKFQYNITEPIRLEGSFSYFFPKKESQKIWGVPVKTTLNMWNISVNGHYLFSLSDKIKIYPLAGLGVVGLNAKASALGQSESGSKNHFGVNLGVGSDFNITDNIALNLEWRYMLVKDGKILFALAGLAYKF